MFDVYDFTIIFWGNIATNADIILFFFNLFVFGKIGKIFATLSTSIAV